MLEALTPWWPWWPDFASFLRMGKHGFYVWSSFGVCALTLAAEWWLLWRQRRRSDNS
jgi:heme exporter protein CcmD